jgi:hypothetical protein
MYSGTGNTTSLVLGFPIRTSSDQRSVDSSPRLIAASYVLHRLSMPRHPPCALKHLQHKKPKMSKNCTSDYAQQTPHPPKEDTNRCALDARNHYPQIKHHTPPPSRAETNSLTEPLTRGCVFTGFPRRGRSEHGPVASKPNSVSGGSPQRD